MPRCTSAVAEVVGSACPFGAHIVFRQVVRAWGRLWEPVMSARWNVGFPALYTGLDLDVALTERLKRTGPVSVRLIVGRADALIARTVDLCDLSILARLGPRTAELVEDYALPQELGGAFLRTGVTGLLVPAAIAETAHLYPRFRLVREGQTLEVRQTPAQGVNLVIFTDNLVAGDRYPEIDRFTCEIRGLPAS
jgi:RES domain-containing protein